MSLYDPIAMRRRLTEADVLSGCEELARMADEGLPVILQKAGCEAPGAVLRRLCDQLTPGDFSGGMAALWAAASPLWMQGRAVPLEQTIGRVPSNQRAAADTALDFVRAHGMALPYTAPVAAARLLALAACVEVIREAQEQAAAKIDEARAVFDGVV